jgi:hypothetical protein
MDKRDPSYFCEVMRIAFPSYLDELAKLPNQKIS